MPLYALSENELREHCKRSIEALEYWLRRLIDQRLTAVYGANYLDAERPSGDRIIAGDISRRLNGRAIDRLRFPRPIDAALLDDLIHIICNPELYNLHFKASLQDAYPNESFARTQLSRLVRPRNCLSHANPISVHDAYRVLCYSQDVIEALKAHYRREGLQQQFNVPSVVRVMDSLGHVAHLVSDRLNPAMLDYSTEAAAQLRCGDTLSIEVTVDPSFDAEKYDIRWSIANVGGATQFGPRFTLLMTEQYVSARFCAVCYVVSREAWHKLGTCDDQVDVAYRVLPP